MLAKKKFEPEVVITTEKETYRHQASSCVKIIL